MATRSLIDLLFAALYVAFVVGLTAFPLVFVFLGPEPVALGATAASAVSAGFFFGISMDIALHRSLWALSLWLLFVVPALILVYAACYTRVGLVETATAEPFFPSWTDALYFSIVTFTTLGYGDLAPREESVYFQHVRQSPGTYSSHLRSGRF